MSALVVDTSVWADFFRGEPLPMLEAALQDGRVWVPPVVCSELLSAPLSDKQRRAIEALLNDLPLCPTPREHWFSVGALRSQLARRGLTVSTPDAHVAQCAIDLDATLWSRDKIFTRIAKPAGLKLVVER